VIPPRSLAMGVVLLDVDRVDHREQDEEDLRWEEDAIEAAAYDSRRRVATMAVCTYDARNVALRPPAMV
jgi:hypothetical protein